MHLQINFLVVVAQIDKSCFCFSVFFCLFSSTECCCCCCCCSWRRSRRCCIRIVGVVASASSASTELNWIQWMKFLCALLMINCSRASKAHIQLHTHTHRDTGTHSINHWQHRHQLVLAIAIIHLSSSSYDSTRIWHCNFECQLIRHQFLLLPSLSAVIEQKPGKKPGQLMCTKCRYPA